MLINKSFLFGVIVTLLVIILIPILFLKLLPYFYEPPAQGAFLIEDPELPQMSNLTILSEITEHCLLYKDLEQPFDELRLPIEVEKRFCECYRFGINYRIEEDNHKKLQEIGNKLNISEELDINKAKKEAETSCINTLTRLTTAPK